VAPIGKTLRRLRLSRGLTQAQLAAPKYTHAFVSTIESGRRRPSREALEHFARKLDVDVEELETGRSADVGLRLQLRLQDAAIELSAGGLQAASASLSSIAREAKRQSLPQVESKAEELLGMWLERLGEPEQALEHYERSNGLLSSEPATARADAVAGIARCFQALGDVRFAIHVLESLVEVIERDRLTDPSALTRLHASLVDAYLDAGLYRRAAESAAELAALAPRVSDPLRIAQVHMNVARLHASEGRTEHAKASLRRAEDAYAAVRLRTEMAGAYLATGYILSREGQVGAAREQLRLALDIFEQTGNVKDQTRTLNELARVERLQDNRAEAERLLEKSIKMLSDGDTPILAWAHRELAHVLAVRNPARAEKHFRVSIELFERAEQPVEIAVTYGGLGDLLSSQDSAAEGCRAYRAGIAALESTV
jgi:tetratricopeptide (TPR) repeat protein